MMIFNLNFMGIYKKQKQFSIFNLRGFTIIELLVAMGLFVILVGIASGGFIKVLRMQRLIVELMSANDNVSSALEQMAREIRMGYDFNKISETELQFVNTYDIKVSYKLNDKTIERCVEESGLWNCKKITAEKVNISNFKINLLDNNDYPPRITISLSAGVNDKYFENTPINIQTTISSRIY